MPKAAPPSPEDLPRAALIGHGFGASQRMGTDSLRRQIAREAARLLGHREESEFYRAKWKATLRLAGPNVRSSDIPGNREIRGQLSRLERSLERDSLGLSDEQSSIGCHTPGDRFRLYETLLLPLEQVHESRKSHPEGDVLYHSLQVFELARHELPYDEEFLLAALLHDVGKAIDPKEPTAAALEALDGAITPRTAWLIEHRAEATMLHQGTLGIRARRRLEASESFEELQLLAACDRNGRVRGRAVADVQDALQYVRELVEANEQ